MVGSLTVGKKKYAAVEPEIKAAMESMEALRLRLLALVEEDARVFAPLAEAYKLPNTTDEEKAEKARVMEACLRDACDIPLAIMECCCEAIQLQRVFGEKGSVIAVSDAGVGVAICKAALQGAYLNVKINTRSMKDRDYAASLDEKADALMHENLAAADEIYDLVLGKLR
jgi:formiminotetrahydrofolate cyclodeaminase